MNGLKDVFVIDKLENIGKYATLGAHFKTACDALARGGFTSFMPGRNEIDGANVFVNSDAPRYVLPEDRRAELHHAYFDIHVPLTHDERMGLARFDPAAPGSFDEAKDCGFYEQPVTWYVIHPGEFCIIWPKTCLHAPAVSATGEAHDARKLVVKIHS